MFRTSLKNLYFHPFHSPLAFTLVVSGPSTEAWLVLTFLKLALMFLTLLDLVRCPLTGRVSSPWCSVFTSKIWEFFLSFGISNWLRLPLNSLGISDFVLSRLFIIIDFCSRQSSDLKAAIYWIEILSWKRLSTSFLWTLSCSSFWYCYTKS